MTDSLNYMAKTPLNVIVLAGGFGTRLKSVTGTLPKALAPINDIVFLDIVLAQVIKSRPERIILCLHYNVDAFKNYLKNCNIPIDIEILEEDTPLGTGGAIKNAFDHFPELASAAVINSDTLSKLNLREMLGEFEKYQAKAMIGLSKVTDRTRYGSVSVKGNLITNFSEKNIDTEGWINNGYYFLSREIFRGMKKKFSIENEIFKQLVKSSDLLGFKVQNDEFFDIGTPEDYFRFTNQLSNSCYDIKTI